MFGNVAGKDIHARHIKRDRNHTKSSIDALAQPRGDTLPNVLVERHHKAAFLECGDKRCGRNERAVLVNPAGECFGTNNLAGFHIDLGLQVVGNATVRERVLEFSQRAVEHDFALVLRGAENGNALLEVVFCAPIGKHGLRLRIDGDLLIGVDGVNAHGRPKTYAVIMPGYCLANAVVDLMDGDVLKGDEYAKVILAPVPCDAHVGVLDILEDRAHIGEYAVTFGLAVPFIKQAHVAHVDRGDAPGTVAPCLEKCVGAPHKLAGSIEAREQVDAFGDGAFALRLGYGEAVVGNKLAGRAKATVEFA